MASSHAFLSALTMVLCVAAVTTVVCQRLRQPVVLGYMIAGLIIGPHLPIPLVADPGIVDTLSELGVILLMFSLGLEFSFGKLARVGPTAALRAVVQCSMMLWLGFLTGRLFGWTPLECLFAGAIVAISSTTIIAKAFDERGIKGTLRDLVVGVLIVEDLIAILLMAGLTAISTGKGVSADALVATVGRLAGFLVALIVVGMMLVPRFMRAVTRLKRPETTLVASVGVCFAVALLAQYAGYSAALGAFIAGSLVAESGEEKIIEPLVHPVRDMFGAIFFVSVGMLIDPKLIVENWPAVLVLSAVVICGKVVSVTLAAFLNGVSPRLSIQAGMSLAQIGEFSFIIAGLGVTLNATRSFLYPVAIAVSALTTLTTPWLIGASGSLASWVDRKLPRPLQTFATLYGTWVEQLRTAPARATANAEIRRLVRFLVLDAVLLAGIVVGTALQTEGLVAFVETTLKIPPMVAHPLIVVLAIVLSTPFGVGIIRVVRRLALLLAELALPAQPAGRVDLAVTPRRALVVAMELTSVLLVGLPMLALTQPFITGLQGAVAFTFLAALLGFILWRSAIDLQGHVRAGAQVIVEALSARAQDAGSSDSGTVLNDVHPLLPGLGAPLPIQLALSSPALGKTLAQLHLRELTGATVLAIQRGVAGTVIPTAHEVLQAGDILVVAGTQAAVDAARTLL